MGHLRPFGSAPGQWLALPCPHIAALGELEAGLGLDLAKNETHTNGSMTPAHGFPGEACVHYKVGAEDGPVSSLGVQRVWPACHLCAANASAGVCRSQLLRKEITSRAMVPLSTLPPSVYYTGVTVEGTPSGPHATPGVSEPCRQRVCAPCRGANPLAALGRQIHGERRFGAPQAP